MGVSEGYYFCCYSCLLLLLLLSYIASIYTQQAFTHSKLLHTASFDTQHAFAQGNFYAQQALTHRSFHTQQASTHSKHLHTASLYTTQAFTHSKLSHPASFYTEKLLQTEAFTHRKPLRCQAKGSDTVPAAGSIHRVHIKIPWGHHSLRPTANEKGSKWLWPAGLPEAIKYSDPTAMEDPAENP